MSERGHGLKENPPVGRQRPPAVLRAALARAQEGERTIIFLTGDAGVGKSRLAAEIMQDTVKRDFFVATLRGYEQDRALPFAALGALWRSWGLPLPNATGNDVYALYQTTGQELLDRAGAHPIYFLIEDVQWVDEASLQFLLYWTRQWAAAGFILLTLRAGEPGTPLQALRAAWVREQKILEVTLPPMTRAETDEMIRALFGQVHPVRSDFLDAVYALTEGNPFYIEETLGSLVNAGDIFFTRAGWDRKPLPQLHIPGTLQDVVGTRMAKLSVAAREMLELAAVMGRRFEVELLRELTGQTEAEVDTALREMQRLQLIVEESADRFAFRHALTRQAVYEKMLLRDRRAAHRRVAGQLERGAASEPTLRVDALAYHTYQAEWWGKAAHYAVLAGEQAQQLYAPRAAIEFFVLAQNALLAQGIAPTFSLYFALARAHEVVGEFEAAHADYGHALTNARAAGNRDQEWQALQALGFLWAERDFRQSHDYLHQALTLARTLQDPAQLAVSLNRYGNWYANANELDEALQDHQEALALYAERGDERGRAETLDLIGTVQYLCGALGAGVDALEQAIPIWRALDERRSLCSSLSMVVFHGLTAFTDSVPWRAVAEQDGLARLSEAHDLAEGMGWRFGQADAWISAAMGLAVMGRYRVTFDYLERGMQIAREIDHRMELALGEMMRGALLLDLLGPERALTHLERALELANRVNGGYIGLIVTGMLVTADVAMSEFGRAEKRLRVRREGQEPIVSQAQRHVELAVVELELAQGKTQEALKRLERTVASIPETNGMSVIPRVWTLRARILLRLERETEAQKLLSEAIEVARQQELLPQLWRAEILLGHLWARQGEKERASKLFESAQSLTAQLADEIPDDEVRDEFLKRASARLPQLRERTPNQNAKRAYDGLTRREREIAGMVGQGKTNREIAGLLVVSERTVDAHVGSILGKLNFGSRAQIAVWAAEKGLVEGNERV